MDPTIALGVTNPDDNSSLSSSSDKDDSSEPNPSVTGPRAGFLNDKLG